MGKLIGPGIDVLVGNSYAVAPPSIHDSGNPYKWMAGRGLVAKSNLRPLPRKWRRFLEKKMAALQKGATAKSTKTTKTSGMPKVREGTRNTALTKFAGSLVRVGCTGQALVAALHAYNAEHFQPQLEAHEVQKVAESVERYSPANDGEDQPGRDYQVYYALRSTLAAARQQLMYLPGQGFYRYANGMWSHTKDKVVEKLILEEVQNVPPDQRGKSTSLVSDVHRLMMIDLTTDRDPINGRMPRPIINCTNGEVHLADEGTAKLRPHSPKSGLTSILNVHYDPNAICPLYDKALRTIFKGTTNPEAMAAYWNELFGYLIQPCRDHAVILMLIGSGNNGKTELMRTVLEVVGSGFVYSARLEDLERNRFAMGHLAGKLVFYDDDLRSGAKLPDGILKKISEGKTLTGESKGRDPVQFFNTAVPVLAANNPPTTSDLSHGLRRRLHVIPFDHTFVAGKDLDKKLWPLIRHAEMPGILNRAIAGLGRLRRRGDFKLPVDVVRATERWLQFASPLKSFVAECTVVRRDARTLVADIYQAYTEWAEKNGVTFQLQRNTLARQLKQLGYNVGDDKRGSVVIGLALKKKGVWASSAA